ncbi:MAG: cation:proton antiporter subunit C [Planctomycetes bacterium]|nr:cation:proton antiporter subunit C [Planctomycetota bacterium]
MPPWAGHFNYWIYVVLMMVGLYAAIAKGNLVKKLLGLSLFQTGIFIFYISTSVILTESGQFATVPILAEHGGPLTETYANPLPHVLILTAIVVSVSTMAVALAIVVNIKREFGTIESDELLEQELAE